MNSLLSSHNLTSALITLAGDWISVNTTVSQANALLAAIFSTFQNQDNDTNQTVVHARKDIPTSTGSLVHRGPPLAGFI
ncbi:hypothetical protein FB451DRAFT_599116 [Mycena latifolia]|nr:hypothetical protein FB451DRAFT_599116 [Mycena latifolia]